MLIRLVVKNVFSFGEQVELSLFPGNFRTLGHHKYNFKEFELLKLSAIYGANGAGKSNVFKCLHYFRQMVLDEDIPGRLLDSTFKFNNDEDSKDQLLAVEFLQDEQSFYYAVIINGGVIKQEELYKSGLGEKPDELVFERKTNLDGLKASLLFNEVFEGDSKSKVLKDVLENDFIKPEATALKLLSNRDYEYLADIKVAFKWFSESLQTISPQSKAAALAHNIETDLEFKKFAEDLMCAFNIGIEELFTEKVQLRDYFGRDNISHAKELEKELDSFKGEMLGFRINDGQEIIAVKEDGKYWAKVLKTNHTNLKRSVPFDLDEESDGTRRLLDFIPAFQSMLSERRVYFVDEIERSIHPLLIKELIKKFSEDESTLGQLIFTTHESNLLDQEIFRQDEIWFVEKDFSGSTNLYSLGEFREHKSIDIRKGYLKGRYGSIPFLGNLKDLNWHKYDFKG